MQQTEAQKEREALALITTELAYEEARQSGLALNKEELEEFIRRALDDTVQLNVHRKEPEFDPNVVHHMFSYRDNFYSIKITNLTVNMKRLFKNLFTDSLLLTTGVGVDASVGHALTGHFILAAPFFGILCALRRVFTESNIPSLGRCLSCWGLCGLRATKTTKWLATDCFKR